jgi:hypothetical protein
MTKTEAYIKIAQSALDRLPASDDSVLACMAVLRLNDIVLDDTSDLSDMGTLPEGTQRRLSAVTRRQAAEIVAAAMGNDRDPRIIDHWYAQYSSRTPYEVIEEVPESFLKQVLAARGFMKESPIVRDVIEAE